MCFYLYLNVKFTTKTLFCWNFRVYGLEARAETHAFK